MPLSWVLCLSSSSSDSAVLMFPSVSSFAPIHHQTCPQGSRLWKSRFFLAAAVALPLFIVPSMASFTANNTCDWGNHFIQVVSFVAISSEEQIRNPTASPDDLAFVRCTSRLPASHFFSCFIEAYPALFPCLRKAVRLPSSLPLFRFLTQVLPRLWSCDCS